MYHQMTITQMNSIIQRRTSIYKTVVTALQAEPPGEHLFSEPPVKRLFGPGKACKAYKCGSDTNER